MQLSVRTFGQIVEALQNRASNSGSDKRRLSRIEVQTKVKVGKLVNNELKAVYSGLSRDVSQGGIGLFVSVPIEIGEKFVIELPRMSNERSVLICMAMFARAVANGIFTVGAEYAGEADKELVFAWDHFEETQQKRIAAAMTM